MTHFLRFALTRLAPFVPYALSLAAVLLLGEAQAQTPRKCGTLRGNNLTVCYGDNETADKIIRLDPASIENFPNTYIEWRDEKTSAIIHFTGGTERARELPLGMLTAWFAQDSEPKRTLASATSGQLHVVIATQKWPTTPVPPEGCTESDKAYFYIIQQPRLTPGPTPSSSARVCNGTSITLSISGSPSASLTEASIAGNAASSTLLGRGAIRFNTEFTWKDTPHATFNGANNIGPPRTYASPNASVTIGVSPEPEPSITLNFSYVRRYRVQPIEGFNVSSQACPSGASGEHRVDVFQSISANVGAPRTTSSTLCTGKTELLSIDPPLAGVIVKRWERLRQGSQAPPVQLRVESHNLEASVPRGFEPGAYAYSAVLGRANDPSNTCEVTTAPIVITVQQFDLNPLVVPGVCAGGEVRFSSLLATSGGADPVYSWRVKKTENFEIIPATGDPIHNVTLEDGIPRLTIAAEHLETVRNYRYKLKAGDGICGQETPEAAVPAGEAPIIRTDPSAAASAAGCAGETLDLFVLGGAVGENIKYQWQTAVVPEGAQPPFNNLTFTDLGDEKESREGDRLLFPYSETNQNKAIRVKITHATGGCSAYSTAFKPSYSHHRPVITADLTDKENACLGAPDTFSLTTENTGAGTSYQWFRGTSLTDPGTQIEGAAEATYRIASYAEEHNGQYFWVVIRNGNVCPPATSRRARVTTKRGPTLGTLSTPTRASCTGPLIRFTMTGVVPAPGETQVTYRWMEVNPERPNQPEYITDPLVTTPTAPNPAHEINTNGKDGFRYIVVLFGNGCELRSPLTPPFSAATNNLQLREIQPASPAPVCAGGSVTLSIEHVPGTGAMPLTYEWRRTDAALPGGIPFTPALPPLPHGSTLILSDLRLEGTRATKTYTVTVTDASGCAVTSTARIITVQDPGQNYAQVTTELFPPPPTEELVVVQQKFCHGKRVECIAYYQPGSGYSLEWEELKPGSDMPAPVSSLYDVAITPGIVAGPPHLAVFQGRSFLRMSLPATDPSVNPSVLREDYRYRVKVTNNTVQGGCPYYSTTLTARFHPAITLTRPADQNICEPVQEFFNTTGPNNMDDTNGGSGTTFPAWNRIRGRAEFTVLPPGVNPNLYTYRWMRNGVPLTIGFNPENLVGSFTENNGSKLIIRGAKPSDNGRYWAEVTSLPAAGSCTVFSEAATLAVKVRPPALNTYYTTNLGSSGNLPGSRDTEAPNPGILRQIDMCVPRSKVVMGLSFANGEEQGLQFRWQESRPLNASVWSDYADITANHPYADFSTVTTSRLELNQADRNAVSGYRYRLKVTHGELGCIDYYPKRGEWYAGNGGGGGVSNRGDRQLYERDLFRFQPNNATNGVLGIQWRPWNYPPPQLPPFHAPGQPDVPIDPAKPLMPIIKVENNCVGNDATLQIQPILPIPNSVYNYQIFYVWVKKPTLETPDAEATPLFSETAWPRSYPPIFNPRLGLANDWDPGEFEGSRDDQAPMTLTIRNLQASDEGYYSMRARSAPGGLCYQYQLNDAASLARATAPWVYLTAGNPPQVDTHVPDNKIVCASDSEAVFEVRTTASVVWKEATPNAPTAFHDFVLPPPYDDTRRTNRLVLPASYFAGKNGYKYRAEVRNSGSCMIYSPNAAGSVLELRPAPPTPVISGPVRACEVGDAVLTITDPQQGANYQWMRAGVALANGTQASGMACAGVNTHELLLTNVHPEDAVAYTVRRNAGSSAADNGCPSQLSEPFRLLLVGNPPPPVPADQVFCQNSESSYSVTLPESQIQYTPTWEKRVDDTQFTTIPESNDVSLENRAQYDAATRRATLFLRNSTSTPVGGASSYRLVFTSNTPPSPGVPACYTESEFLVTVKAAPTGGIRVNPGEAGCSGPLGRATTFRLEASGGGPFPGGIPKYRYELLSEATGERVPGTIEWEDDGSPELPPIAGLSSGYYTAKIKALTGTGTVLAPLPECEVSPRPRVQLTVLPTPVLGPVTISPWTICHGESPTLRVTRSGAMAGQSYSYEWFQGTGTTSISGVVETNPWTLPPNLASNLTPGNTYAYKVRVTATMPAIPATATTPAVPAQGCSAMSDEAILTVNANPNPTWERWPGCADANNDGVCDSEGNGVALCTNEEVLFRVAEVADASYQWQQARPIAGGGVPLDEDFVDIPDSTRREYILPNPHANPRRNPIPPSIMEKNGYYYRVKVSLGGFGGTPSCLRTSTPKKLTVKGGYFRNLLPDRVATCVSTHYTYQSEFFFSPTPPNPDRRAESSDGFSYQWSFKSPGTADFLPLPIGASTPAARALGRLYKYDINSSGAINTGTYRVTVTDVRPGGTGCAVSSDSEFAIGNAIIEKQPEDRLVCLVPGEEASAVLEVKGISKDVFYRWIQWTEASDTDTRPHRQVMMDAAGRLPENNNRGILGGDARGYSRLTVSQPGFYRVLLVSTIRGADTDFNGDGSPDPNYRYSPNGEPIVDNGVPPDFNIDTNGNGVADPTDGEYNPRTCFQLSRIVEFRNHYVRPTNISIVPHPAPTPTTTPSATLAPYPAPAPFTAVPPNGCARHDGGPGDPYTYKVNVTPSPYPYNSTSTPPYIGYAYQWKKQVPNGSVGWFSLFPIEYATGRIYTIPAVTEAMNNSRYSVRVTVLERITTRTVQRVRRQGGIETILSSVTTRPTPATNPIDETITIITPEEQPDGSVIRTITHTFTGPRPTNCRDSLDNAPVLLRVLRKPRVTLHPQDAAVCQGTSAIFIAGTDLPGGLTPIERYQWFRKTGEQNGVFTGTPIPGTNNFSWKYALNTNIPDAVNGGQYYAMIRNIIFNGGGTGYYFCTANTNAATLTIHPLPTGTLEEVIVPPPGNIPEGTNDGYWCAGEDRHFRITPSGTLPPYTYDWGVRIGTQAGTLPTDAAQSYTTPATPAPDNLYSGRLTLPRVPFGSRGNTYTVKVTDSRGCRSAEVLSPALRVEQLPPEPWLADRMICTGQEATFTVVSLPLTETERVNPLPYVIGSPTGTRFLWKKNGVVWPREEPPEDPPYTWGITRITPPQLAAVQDRYTVTVRTEDGCKRTSPPAWLRVTAKPAITSVAPDGGGNCSNAPIRMVAKNGDAPLSGVLFQWSKSLSPPTYDVIPAAENSSATGNPLVLPALTPPATWNGYRYKVKASPPENPACFTEFETTVALAVNPPPARPEVYLETPPVCEGHAAKFRITPEPPAPFNPTDYQWKSHKPSSGNAPTVTNVGTGITYEIPVTSRASDNDDSYTVTVTDNATHCQASSLPVLLTVHARPAAETVSYEPVCANEKAVFKINDPLPGIVRRQWEERTDFTGAFFRSIPTTASGLVTEPTEANPNPVPAANPTADRGELEVFPTLGKINYRYRVKSFNAEGCWRASADDDASNAAVLTVKPLPVLTLPPPPAVCPGTNVSFSVTIDNMAGTHYKWTKEASLPEPFPNGPRQLRKVDFDDNTPTLSLPATGRLTREADNGSLYAVTVTGANGCKAVSESRTLRVFPTPGVDSAPTLSPSPVCSNKPVTVQITNPGGSVQWEAALPGNPESFAAITHRNPDNPTNLNAHVVSAPSNGYRYRVKLTSANGCDGYSPSSPPLVVNAAPTAEAIPDKSICAGEEVTFTARASGGTPPYTYLWRRFNLESLPITDQNPDPDKLGFTASSAENGNTYDVIVSDANQCTATSSAGRLTVNARPEDDVPSLRIKPLSTTVVTNACSNRPVVLELATGPDSPRPEISWEWQEAPPVGQFTTLPSSRNAREYQVPTAGRNGYRYRIEVRDSYCTAVANDAQVHVLNVHEPPVIENNRITHSPASICGTTGSVTYSVAASGAGLTYQWETLSTDNNSVYVHSGNSPQINRTLIFSDATAAESLRPLRSGYLTRVRITDGNGCVTVSEPSTLIRTPPPVIGSLTGQTICSGDQTKVELGRQVGLHYKWSASPDPGVTGASARTEPSPNNVIAQTLDNGEAVERTVTYSVTPSLNGCPGDSQDVTVTVRPKPDVTVSEVTVSGVRPGGNRICAGKEFKADLSSPTANTRYKWNVEASDKVMGYENQTVSVDASEIRQTLQTTSFVNEPVTYWITPTIAYGSLLCVGETRSLGLTLRAPVRIDKHPQGQVACPGSSVELSVDAKGTPDVTYEWLLNGTKIEGATEPTYRAVLGASGYNARYTVRVSNVCTSAPNKLSYDAELSLPAAFEEAAIRPAPATPQYLEPVTFSYTGPEASSYEWDFGDNTPRSPFASPVHNYAEPDKSHRVSLTVVTKKGNCRKTITLDLGAVTGKAYDPYTGDLAGRKGIEFYPVPLEEKLIIKSEKRMLSVSLSSILGSRLLRSSVNDTETALNTSNFIPGTYVLSVETEEGVFHFKVVK